VWFLTKWCAGCGVRDGIPWVWCLDNLKKGLYFLFTSNYHYVYRDVKLVGSPAEASAARS
jgi:hypothetical protein